MLRAQLPAQAVEALSLEQLTAAMLDALRFSAYPDAPAALARLRARGLTLVVVSNWDISLPAVLRERGPRGDGGRGGDLGRGGAPKAGPGDLRRRAGARRVRPRTRGASRGTRSTQDIHGALAAGIRAVLLRRDDVEPEEPPPSVPRISSLAQLPPLLECAAATVAWITP